MKRKREVAHHRLTGDFAGYGATGGGGASPMMQQQPQGYEERRRSFFYAEDELRGYDDGQRQEEMTYRAGAPAPSVRRGPIQASLISAPILRENSLNW